MKNLTGRSKRILMIGGVALFSMIAYIAYSHYYYAIGFPLDDAWIHQTYARNLATYGEWAFIPGKISAGSTSPLWTVLLAPAYLMKVSSLVWTFFIGWVILWSVGLLSMTLFEQYCPGYSKMAFWVGMGMVLEWHVVWAAVSGMETLLFGLLILLIFLDVGKIRFSWFLRGIFVGLSIWVRPDGVVLFFPLLFIIYFKESSYKSKIGAALLGFIGVACFFVPYLGFNRLLAGDWWPNTFYAKQAEYAIMREIPLWKRFFKEFSLPMVGVGIILLPGFILFIYDVIKRTAWGFLAPVLLFIGYTGLYGIRLPVTYQHGRYIIPVMPLFFIMGMSGLVKYHKISSNRLLGRVLYKAGILSGIIVLLMFWFLGLRAYGKDVGFIQSEMVTTAKWIDANTEPGALIAAHDIGALGYWGHSEIVDLAGLISPDVISFIRDEQKIKQYLDERGAEYLVIFPGWYPYLSSLGEEIYQTNGKISIELGGENMIVYRWKIKP